MYYWCGISTTLGETHECHSHHSWYGGYTAITTHQRTHMDKHFVVQLTLAVTISTCQLLILRFAWVLTHVYYVVQCGVGNCFCGDYRGWCQDL